MTEYIEREFLLSVFGSARDVENEIKNIKEIIEQAPISSAELEAHKQKGGSGPEQWYLVTAGLDMITGRKKQYKMKPNVFLGILGKSVKLENVEYIPTDKGTSIYVRIDGKTYCFAEDEDDGYRSYMIMPYDEYLEDYTEIKDIPKKFSNSVQAFYLNSRHGYTSDLICFMDDVTDNIVLIIGTENTADYYPMAVFEWFPERMNINRQNQKPVMNDYARRWLWASDGDGYVCPECGRDFCIMFGHVSEYRYCPVCGIRLLPPIGEAPDED